MHYWEALVMPSLIPLSRHAEVCRDTKYCIAAMADKLRYRYA